MAWRTGIEGKFSGHSLEIGGAVVAMMGGMTMAQIRAFGGWESKAVQFYLQAIGAAAAGASRSMDF